jgi:hypothetical protein
MPLSLGSGRGGYGFGVRAMRPVIIAGRTRAYSNNAVIHYDQPNGSFEYTTNRATLNVYGADGNLSGTVSASTIIDGASQIFVNGAMTYSNGYFWGFAKNAAGEVRLVRADWAGNIVTPGAKFTTANAFVIAENICFVYESGNNLIINSYRSQNQYQIVVSKVTGQVVSETITVNGIVSLAAGTYVTADGTARLASITKPSNTDSHIVISGLVYNGDALVSMNLFSIELLGGEIRLADTWRPVLVGDLILFNSIGSDSLTFNYVTRVEFDRWLTDFCKKFDVAG